jgi:hypothetical protein
MMRHGPNAAMEMTDLVNARRGTDMLMMESGDAADELVISDESMPGIPQGLFPMIYLHEIEGVNQSIRHPVVEAEAHLLGDPKSDAG